VGAEALKWRLGCEAPFGPLRGNEPVTCFCRFRRTPAAAPSPHGRPGYPLRTRLPFGLNAPSICGDRKLDLACRASNRSRPQLGLAAQSAGRGPAEGLGRPGLGSRQARVDLARLEFPQADELQPGPAGKRDLLLLLFIGRSATRSPSGLQIWPGRSAVWPRSQPGPDRGDLPSLPGPADKYSRLFGVDLVDRLLEPDFVAPIRASAGPSPDRIPAVRRGR